MVISIGIFLVVTLGLLGLTQVLPRRLLRDRRKVHQRLVQEFGPERFAKDGTPVLFKDLEALELSTAVEEYTHLGQVAVASQRAFGTRRWLEDELECAHLHLSPARWLTVHALFLAVLSLAGTLLFGWVGALAGGAAGLMGPWQFLQARRRARQDRFMKQLPAAFELMARVIRGGQSVPQALQAVTEAFDDPLAEAFAYCQHQQSFGLRPDLAFQEMARRSGLLELRIFAMAMAIQQKTGGHLSEVLDRLATLIRARLRLRQQIRTLTAEGRLQGVTLVIMPFLIFGMMFFINRSYAEVLLEHVGLIVATLACMAMGMLWIRAIVRFEG